MSNGPQRRPLALLERIPRRDLIQPVFVVLAVLLAANGARILNNSPRTQDLYLANFDSAALWLGLALFAVIVAAWQPIRFSLSSIRAMLQRIWDEHYLEALFFIGIIGIAIFMRFYHFNTSLPPANGLCCEEYINGGVAYHALQGDRPLLFPLVRWTSALGFLVFGDTTWGLRFFFPVMGVATLVIFYFLLRQFVRVQAALFTLALFAVAWWPSLRNRQATGGTLFAVLFAFLLIRGIKTKSRLMFLAAGVVAGLISYEYEAFRPVPMIAAGFLGLAAAKTVVVDGPLHEARQRAVDLLRVAWRPAGAFLLAAGIVLVPMVIGTHQGKDLYLTSVNRNVDTRGGSRLADDWPDQLRWASTMFLPFSPTNYPTSPPRDIPNTHLFDPLTASLVTAGFVAGVLFLRRGYRAWFVGWLVLILTGGALILGEFAPWSFFGLVPILLALAAYFVDDVQSLVQRLRPQASRALTILLVVGVAFSFWWNFDKLFNDIENNYEVQRVYGGEISFMYSMCNHLRDRPSDNFTIAYSNAVNTAGFSAPRDTEEEERRAWSDFIWACHDLQGSALPAPQEAWPLRDLPDGPLTLMVADPIVPADAVISELNMAYPGLGQPDYRITGPAGTYELFAYDFANGSELRRPGLWGTYTSADGTTASQLDPFPVVESANAPIEPPFSVTWTGVVYVDKPGSGSIVVVNGPAADVLVDGAVGPRQFLPGWHTVEISVTVQELGEVTSLAWQDDHGEVTPIHPLDYFPLTDLHGWRHTRSMGLAGSRDEFVTQRLDFSPHYAMTRAIARPSGEQELFVTQERWEGVLDLEEDSALAIEADFRAGTLSLVIDGEELLGVDATDAKGTVLRTSTNLSAGRHTIELTQTLAGDTIWSGATLSILDSRGVSPKISPY